VEYTGDDFQADMQRMAADPEVQRWWDECKPCFESIDGLASGEVWLPMEQVFYQS
jgi:L-rhamnose mutarotase